MMIETSTGVPVDAQLVRNYFHTLVNHFFKILPMRENNEDSLNTYMKGLQAELLGCGSLIKAIDNDPAFLTLVSILQYLIDFPECTVREVKREVFGAISLCNKLKAKYSDCERGVDDGYVGHIREQN